MYIAHENMHALLRKNKLGPVYNPGIMDMLSMRKAIVAAVATVMF